MLQQLPNLASDNIVHGYQTCPLVESFFQGRCFNGSNISFAKSLVEECWELNFKCANYQTLAYLSYNSCVCWISARATRVQRFLSVRVSISASNFNIEMSVGFNKCLLSVSVHAAKLPRITTHPEQLKDAVPGETLAFTVKASGAEPLSYQWEIETGDESRKWQMCDVETFPGANSSTLTIASVQKSNEGSYRCTITTCAGSETSEPVNLNIGKIQIIYFAVGFDI